jgi:hypothetical protein
MYSLPLHLGEQNLIRSSLSLFKPLLPAHKLCTGTSQLSHRWLPFPSSCIIGNWQPAMPQFPFLVPWLFIVVKLALSHAICCIWSESALAPVVFERRGFLVRDRLHLSEQYTLSSWLPRSPVQSLNLPGAFSAQCR